MDAPETSPPPLRMQPEDPSYQALAEAEARFWADPPVSFEEHRDQTDGPVDRYVNQRFTGNPTIRWEDRIAALGPFRRGLVLGGGEVESEARILAANPGLHLTFVDVSAGSLARRAADLGARFPGRVATQVGDLNFLELPADTYDCVISAAVLHHVTNIEFLAWQVNRTLTAGGRFFLQDYVGETRLRFAEAKRRLFTLLHGRLYERQHRRPPTLCWMEERALSPLCGIRCEDTLAVLAATLIECECHTASALIVPLMRTTIAGDGDPAPPHPWWRVLRYRLSRFLRPRPDRAQDWIGPDFLEELTLVGDVASDAGLIAPGIAFAVYRRRE